MAKYGDVYVVAKNDVPGLEQGTKLRFIEAYKPHKFGVKMAVLGTDFWVAVNPCWFKRKSIVEVTK